MQLAWDISPDHPPLTSRLSTSEGPKGDGRPRNWVDQTPEGRIMRTSEPGKPPADPGPAVLGSRRPTTSLQTDSATPLDSLETTERGYALYRWLMRPSAIENLTLNDLIPERPVWMAKAACRGEPITTYFPERGETHQRARDLCSRCPVQQQCADYSMADPDIFGFWAGMGERKRARMRRAAS